MRLSTFYFNRYIYYNAEYTLNSNDRLIFEVIIEL